MKFVYRLPLFLLLSLSLPLLAPAQISVQPGLSAAALAQKLAGPGVTILNPVLNCSPVAVGAFSVSSSNLGLDSGIVLTTGRAASQGTFYGINGASSVNASNNNNNPGDPQLSALTNGATTYDACRLEFDLIPKGDSIRFDYVFGSEEYNNSTCGNYNDAFAFFISGPGINGQKNIALVPGTSIPVAVNSINSGVPGSQGNINNCLSMGAGSPFTAYYVDNSNGSTVTYKGFTTVLKATSAVIPCSTYHLKLTIADAGNGLFDSGVFLKAGSLQTSHVSIRAKGSGNAAPAAIVKGCSSGSFTVTASRKTTPQTLRYLIGGTAQNGVDYAAIADSVVIPANDSTATIAITGLPTALNGTRKLSLYLLSPYSCTAASVVDSASLLLHDSLFARILNADTTVCRGASFVLHAAAGGPFTYSWSPAASLSDATVPSPRATPQEDTRYVLTTSYYPGAGCPVRRDTVHVTVNAAPTVSAGADQSACEGATIALLGSLSSPGSADRFEWRGPDNFLAGAAAATISDALPAQSGVYTVTAWTAGCPPASDEVTITIRPRPSEPAHAPLTELCLNSTVRSPEVTGSNLLWYEGPAGGAGSPVRPELNTAIAGTTVFYVSQTAAGCESDRAAVTVRLTKCCEDYLSIPSAFSPNGDGRNDAFRILQGGEDKIVFCKIFNRWGQLIFDGNEGRLTWDGTYQGQPVEIGTYYYHIQVSCSRGNLVNRTGEITLLR